MGASSLPLLFKVLLYRRKIHIGGVGDSSPISRRNLDAYTRRFHERALDYCDLMAKDVLVDVCIHDMMEEIENLSFSSFS